MKKIDVSGKDCPVPLLTLQKALGDCVDGEEIELTFTCPEAVETLPNYCDQNHLQITNFEQHDNGAWTISIQK
ncbi:MAG: sulfurtransferase TusA family protein [Bombilactobacillus mellifer]|uniref:sulfurtransferase TusA family protein n=1 Tax=Bombilactobacillus mellifer TaxID=1218492 RepID=UPI0018DC385A|nr:sulfurtransferase TusA family protein [Bombilactobacillus mellifer]MBH9991633.1 sulfurtransferase TusA family protein [Lactobacillus sp. W8092]MCT6825869.1 sulfurtransferase TusA family protein [Bombilactobacillus mellifer]MCT6843742.1 sulfurtransferase TusA family protein [Bombilactobacillus mellifer]MCT6894190.1 sulfurtransferase TusA family protein [Bombilactobacillus mellifer]